MRPARVRRASAAILAVTALSAAPGAAGAQTARAQTNPAEPVLVKVKRKPGDATWTEYPARTVEMLPGFTPGAREIGRSKYGGRRDRKVRATGFFRVEKIGDRWWLVDPDGYLYINVGVNGVAPGGSAAPQAAPQAALKTRYGTPEKWAAQTTTLLRENGFNGAGNWSSAQLLRRAAPVPLVYCANGPVDSPAAPAGTRGGFLQAFGRSRTLTRPGVGHTAYPNDCMPVFHPDFAAFCDTYARPLAALKSDPFLLGYFSDNELPYPQIEKYLALKPDDPEMGSSYRAAREWLDKRKGANAKPEDLTDADRDDWAAVVYDRYFRVTTEAIRKYDPNHLCLGSRLYSTEKRKPGVFRAAGKYLDVIAINHYFVWSPKTADIARWTHWSGRPVLLTEWYAKGMDSGFPNTSGAGWTVPTQRDRGLFYQTFTLGLLEAKNCVGWHWFKYLDNDPDDANAEASNRDSNKGMLTIRYEPYAPLVEQMRALNRNVYALADYFDGRAP